MANHFLETIIKSLNQYIASVETTDQSVPSVVFGNIGEATFAGGVGNEDSGSGLENKVVVTLVNISEEGTLKNRPNLQRNGNRYIEQYPRVHVNLYLLFTANFPDHLKGITKIFRVVEFFQGQKVFSFKNTPFMDMTGSEGSVAKKDVELTMEIHTLSFEQLNDLWGSLGGKQRPFVLYRTRLVPLQLERPLGQGGLITEIDLDTVDLT